MGADRGGDAAAAASWTRRRSSNLHYGQPLRVEQCVPAGRQPFDLGAEHVRAVTLLSGAGLEILQDTGSVSPTADVVWPADDLAEFAAAYDWMRWQMVQHVPGYTGGFPIWLWVRIRRSDLISSLRPQLHHSPGSAVIALSIPRQRLLLTDYMAWHDVLNGLPGLPEWCPTCGDRLCEKPTCLDRWHTAWSDAWHARVPRDDQGRRTPWWRWPVELQAELFDTWNLVRQVRRRWPVQACVEHVEADWVTSVRRPF